MNFSDKKIQKYQIKPINVRQLAIAVLVIIIVSFMIGLLILKHKAKTKLQVYSGTIPRVVKLGHISSAQESSKFPEMSFTLRGN